MYAFFVLVPFLLTILYSFFRWNGVGPMTWVGIEELCVCLPGAQPDWDDLQRILAGRVVQLHSGGPWAHCCERDPPRGDRAVRSDSPDCSVPAPGHRARRCRHHLGLVACPPGLDQPDPQGCRSRRNHPCLARRFPLGTPVCRHGRSLGAAGILHRPAVRPGMAKIDPALYESARIDGASWFQEFIAITVPLLRHEIGVCLTVTVIAALAAFDIIWVTTAGGPGNSTSVPGIQIYILAFTQRAIGLASALAVMLMILVVIVILPIQWLTRESAQ